MIRLHEVFDRRRSDRRASVLMDPTHVIIDCDAPPFVPKGWKVEEHRKGGQLLWDPTKLRLFPFPLPKNGKSEGENFHPSRVDIPFFLNANVLDSMLADWRLIPEELQEEADEHAVYVYFLGTTYRHRSGGHRLVRCLSGNAGQWDWNSSFIDLGFVDHIKAAIYVD